MQGRDKAIAMILAKVKPGSGGKGEMGSEYEDEHGDELEAVAHELVEAMQAGDAKGVAEALRGAFACMEAAPHVEGKHVGEEGEGYEEEEEEEEESSESPSNLFAKYFGGGNVRKYAEGGSVDQKKMHRNAEKKAQSDVEKNVLGSSKKEMDNEEKSKYLTSQDMSRKEILDEMMRSAKKKSSDRGALR